MQRFQASWDKLTSGSINRQIFGAAITVALLTAIVKAAAVAKELIVAWRFGTGDALDAFLIAWLIPSFIIAVIAGSFNAAFIPTYIRVREQEGAAAAQQLFSGATIWSLGLLTSVMIVAVGTAPLYLPWIAAGFGREKLNLTFCLLCIMAPVIMLSGIGVICGAVLNAAHRFVLAALSPVVTPAVSALFLLIDTSWGIFALAAGLICGAVLEVALLGAALKRQGISLRPRWSGFDRNLRQVANQYVPMIAGAFLMGGTNLVDQSMAAMLSPGSVASLNYGSRVVGLIVGLAATALSTAVMPYFSGMVAREDWTGIRDTLKRYLRLIFIVTVPLTIAVVLISKPLVQMLYQRGSFTSEDADIVAQVQTFYALQIPFYLAGILVVRLISSLRDSHILMWVSGANLIINVTLNYFFVKRLGVAGIALSTSCVYLFSFLLVLYFVEVRFREINP
ncbi:MAG: murein biosynthesis integral membrane protein MurJ [Pyrinomonadaceae bacterium]|nr:murein biosynthesis integral membrane protein MurJ [Pyrinomonadaceae bacterium]